ncbi:MAG: HutD family protein [Planctomycetes bacterium]|nr:HutD family protein [Planctomycetota bacterium]
MAREILHRTPADSRRTPWRNGRGETEELALWPPAASFERGDFDFRVSRARIEESGPFSPFPGFERLLVVTSGAGILLVLSDGTQRVRLRPLEPVRFDGGDAARAELAAGPVGDFNVFVRSGRGRADVEALRLGTRRVREALGPGHALVHVLAGAAGVRVPREEQPIEAGSGESVWGRELPREEEWELVGRSADALLLVVRWTGST